MREVRDDVRRWLARGDRVALATVVATRRSAPRPVGAKLAISAEGELAGSVSGGCVENEVYEYAQEVLAGAPPRLLTYGISDDLALSVGLPCGGEIDVFVEEARRPLAERLMQIVEKSERAVVMTVLSGDDVGAEVLVTEEGERIGEAPEELAESAPELIRRGRSGIVEVAGREVFADVYGPPPRLLIYGAVDTAEALSRVAQEIGWQPIVADARARFATSERLPSAAEIVVAWPDETLAQVQPDDATAIVILTHDDKFDVPMIIGALATDAFYIGALGSRRNQERRRERLLEEGVDEAALERVSGPCGLDVGAQTPAETAISILAEIMAVRAGREGGRLRDATTRIHAEV
ncbi:MAG TPA: XdhC family protein [Gaiellaceae bacterium]|nr:XdhC family protein [Gaiellaceae bacterium]